jgi:SAM-dependent methyltransferase
MRLTVESQLRQINRRFYEEMAMPFARSRMMPWPGFSRLIDWLPPGRPALLDVGCGEGRLGRALSASGRLGTYVGLDQEAALITLAAEGLTGRFYCRDLGEPAALAGVGRFEAVACVATLQHLPSRARRLRLLREMAAHLAPGGCLVLVNWQFLSSPRQRDKILPWSLVGLRTVDVGPSDFLISWDRGGRTARYVTLIDETETAALAKLAGLRVQAQFRSDGQEGNLNLYTLLARDRAR